MANFSVSPQGLRFNPAVVQGSVAALYATPQTLTFVLKNTSGASVTITNYGFTTSTDGDAVTQPVGIYANSDFTVIPTSSKFPITIANNASHSFSVTFAPLRRGSGFGDIRSALVTLFQGYAPLSNGGAIYNEEGELLNETLPQLVAVGVGGPVTEEAFDWATVNPMFQGSGNDVNTIYPDGYASNSPAFRQTGLSANMTLADIDTTEHYGPMMFWTPNPASDWPITEGSSLSTPWTPRSPAPGSLDYPDVAGTGGTVATTYIATVNYDYGTPRGGRSYQIIPFFGDDDQIFDLTISAVVNVPSNPTLVSLVTWTGLNYANVSGLFIGNNESFNLQGLTLVATTTNLTNPNSTTYNVGAIRTS